MSTPHDTTQRYRQRLLGLLSMTAGFWSLTGPIAASQAWAETPPAARAPEQLRIGYQKSAANLVIVKQQGTLEKRFPLTKVSWIEFPAGPQLLEALSVGALEFGLTGDSPPVFAQAAGKELVYVGAEPAKPESSAILVLRNSPVRTLAELKGKKVALQKGSSAHYLLVRAVAKAGLQWSDIQPIYLAPADARAAFERGSVDAWAIWDPFFAATELAIQLIASFSGLDAGVVSLFLLRRPPSPVGLLSAKTAADQQQVADAFARLALIPKPVQVADIVWQPRDERLFLARQP